MGQLNLALHALLGGPGEGPLGVPQELGLDELFGKSPAVDHYHRLAGSGTGLVDGPGHDLLACSRLARDAHRRPVGLAERDRHLEDLRHGGADDHDLFFGELVLLQGPPPLDLLLESSVLLGPLQCRVEMFRIKGLEQIVIRPEFHRLDGGGDLVDRGRHDDQGIVRVLADVLQDLKAASARHPYIQQHHVGPMLPVCRHGLLAVVGRHDLEVLGFQKVPKRIAKIRFVVNH